MEAFSATPSSSKSCVTLKQLKEKVDITPLLQHPSAHTPTAILVLYQERPKKDVQKEFDEIYIQFYNNWCHTGNKRVFYENIRKWLTYSEKTGGPLIYVGVPANVGGSGNDANYRTIPELAEIYKVRHRRRLILHFLYIFVTKN